MSDLFTFSHLIAFLTLAFLETVLAVDNALVLILQAQGLPAAQRDRAVKIGLYQGAVVRVMLLFGLGYIAALKVPVPVISPLLLAITGHEFTVQGVINLVGGGVLIFMAGHHIRNEWRPAEHGDAKSASSMSAVFLQMLGTNFIFSIDSVLSAVGMVDSMIIASAAVLVSSVVLLTLVAKLSDFLAKYPDFKTLGLCFVFCIGAFLVAEAFGHHVPKGILYSCLGFGLFIQIVDSMRAAAHARRAGEKLLGEIGATELANSTAGGSSRSEP